MATMDSKLEKQLSVINQFALRKSKSVYHFGLSECNRVNMSLPPLIRPHFIGNKYDTMAALISDVNRYPSRSTS